MLEHQSDLRDQENILYSARNGDVEELQKLLQARAEGEIKLDVSCKGITYYLPFVLKECLCLDNINSNVQKLNKQLIKTHKLKNLTKLLIIAHCNNNSFNNKFSIQTKVFLVYER